MGCITGHSLIKNTCTVESKAVPTAADVMHAHSMVVGFYLSN